MPETKVNKKGTDRGFVVDHPLPDDPENIKLSKEQFVAKQRLRREKEAKIAEFAKTLDVKEDKQEEVVSTAKPDTGTSEQRKPKKGRPKNIE